MGESQNQKVDELLQKLKSLGERAKEARSSFGQPLVDRVLERVNKISAKLPNNGHAQQSQQAQLQELKNCPKCFKQLGQDVRFCEKCGFDFQGLEREEARKLENRLELERTSRMGVITGG